MNDDHVPVGGRTIQSSVMMSHVRAKDIEVRAHERLAVLGVYHWPTAADLHPHVGTTRADLEEILAIGERITELANAALRELVKDEA
jgi:hypothetical protein